MKADGKGFDFADIPHGISITGPDGTVGSLSVNKTPTGAVFDLNGTKTPITTVKRGGKQYLSFPWDGHKVFVGPGCSFHIDGGGDLTVYAAPASK
jgi:hypothetical protein